MQIAANKVVDGHVDEDEDDDEESQKLNRDGRRVKRALKKQGVYGDSDSDDDDKNPYASVSVALFDALELAHQLWQYCRRRTRKKRMTIYSVLMTQQRRPRQSCHSLHREPTPPHLRSRTRSLALVPGLPFLVRAPVRPVLRHLRNLRHRLPLTKGKAKAKVEPRPQSLAPAPLMDLHLPSQSRRTPPRAQAALAFLQHPSLPNEPPVLFLPRVKRVGRVAAPLRTSGVTVVGEPLVLLLLEGVEREALSLTTVWLDQYQAALWPGAWVHLVPSLPVEVLVRLEAAQKGRGTQVQLPLLEVL